MDQEKDITSVTHQETEKYNQVQEQLGEQVRELTENLFAIGQGLPEWDILPPETLIQRRRTSI